MQRQVPAEFGFVRIATISPKIEIASPMSNGVHIVQLARRAAENGASAILFPELTLSGYTCEDLFHTTNLVYSSIKALKYIADETKGLDVFIVIGAPFLAPDSRLYNCAFVIAKGQIIGAVPKTHLPNYGEFYEKRWFASGQAIDLLVEDDLLGTFRLNADQLFQCNDLIFGIEICEDLWPPLPRSSYLALAGANCILNLSASNDYVGKAAYRKQLVEQQSARLFVGYAYCSAGPLESTKDVVFSGHMMVAENGITIAESERFSFDDQLLFCDLDLNKIAHDRIHNATFAEQRVPPGQMKVVKANFPMSLHSLERQYSRTPFVPASGIEFELRMREILAIQATGLARRIMAANTKSLVIGLSGGLDSTLAFLVCVLALEKLGRPLNEICAISMPGFGTSARTKFSAQELAQAFAVKLLEISTVESVNLHFRDIGHDPNVQDATYENAQARMRTMILMDYANKLNGLVVGTSDMSELALGWCTYNGDHMSHYAVNASIPKTLVRCLIEWYAEHVATASAKAVLLDVLATPISPELLPPGEAGEITQSTEQILGPYEVHDFFMFHFVRNGFSPRKILYLARLSFTDTYTEKELKNWAKIFFQRFFTNQFKRTCVPSGPKVGSVNLSPRGDWRMPDEGVVKEILQELDT